MRIIEIGPLTALTPEEAELLDQLLDPPRVHEDVEIRRPKVDRTALVVYTVTSPGRPPEKIIAPASDAVVVGMTVMASRSVAKAQRVSSNSTETTELSLVEALVPSDLDL